jgi:hypothetical protein
MGADFSGQRQQVGADVVDFGEQRVEHLAVDRRIVAQRRQQLPLPFELLQDIRLQIGARRHIGDLEQRQERSVVRLGRGLAGEEQRARIQAFEPHQRADALVQRMLVADHRAITRDVLDAASSR